MKTELPDSELLDNAGNLKPEWLELYISGKLDEHTAPKIRTLIDSGKDEFLSAAASGYSAHPSAVDDLPLIAQQIRNKANNPTDGKPLLYAAAVALIVVSIGFAYFFQKNGSGNKIASVKDEMAVSGSESGNEQTDSSTILLMKPGSAPTIEQTPLRMPVGGVDHLSSNQFTESPINLADESSDVSMEHKTEFQPEMKRANLVSTLSDSIDVATRSNSFEKPNNSVAKISTSGTFREIQNAAATTRSEIPVANSGSTGTSLFINPSVQGAISQSSTSVQPSVNPGYFSDAFSLGPQFPGGEMAMQEWIKKERKACFNDTRTTTLSEKPIIKVKCTVNAEGRILTPVILKSLNPECDQEALRLVRMMPRWQPALLNGKPVSQAAEISIVLN